MALSDWTELENLSGEIADSESRLAAARSSEAAVLCIDSAKPRSDCAASVGMRPD